MESTGASRLPASGIASNASLDEEPRRNHVGRLGPELLIVLGGTVFALLGRGRWANVEVDHGFWFSAAQSMVNGGRAMHEVRLQWGPMPLWILEGVGRVFGMRVASFVVFQFVVGMLAIISVQAFARKFLGAVERWICAATLVALIVWMVGPGNLLYPCAFAMSQALLLLLATLLLHDHAVAHGRAIGAVASGLLAGVTFLTKQEFGVAAVLGIGILSLLDPNLDQRAKVRLSAVSAAVSLAVYFGTLFAVADGKSFSRMVQSNLLWPWAPIPEPWKHFNTRHLGLDNVGMRLIEAANSLAIVLAFGGTIWLALYFVDLKPKTRAFGAGGLVAIWMIWWWRWTEGSHFLPMTLVLPAIVAAILLKLSRIRRRSPLPAGEVAEQTMAASRATPPRYLSLWERVAARGGRVRGRAGRSSEAGEGSPGSPSPGPTAVVPASPAGRGGFPQGGRKYGRTGPFLALAAGALVLLQREGYRGNMDAYAGMGYVLAVPVAAPLIWWAIRGPRAAGRKSFIGLAAYVSLVAWFGIGCLHGLVEEWNHNAALSTPRGTVYLTSGPAATLRSTYDFLRAHTARGDRILMIPQTYGMDFLLDLRSLSDFPWIAPGSLDEDELIVRLDATPPKAAVVFGELGSGNASGNSFASGIVQWLRKHLPMQEPFRSQNVQTGIGFFR